MSIFKKRAKRMLSVILVFLMTITTFTSLAVVNAPTAEAKVVTDYTDDFGYYLIDNNTVEIISYEGNNSDVVIPSSIDGKTVVSIGEHAFYSKTIKSIVIPDTVTTICDSAFLRCYNLTDIVFSNNLKSIGKNAFSDCEDLNTLKFPESIEEIGDYAFSGCYSISEIDFPDKGVKIGYDALTNCNWIQNHPDGLIYLGKNLLYAKSYCSRFENGITIKPDTETIAGGALQSVTDESYDGIEINIPESVYYIGPGAFKYSYITEITIPKSVTVIEESTFDSCYSLKTINLHHNITKIGDYAFDLINTRKIVLPKNLIELGEGAFKEAGLVELVINNKLKVIPEEAFAFNFIKDINIPEGVEYIQEGAFAWGDWESAHTTINISDTVIGIGGWAFMETGAVSVKLGKNLQYIGDSGFNFNNCVA